MAIEALTLVATAGIEAAKVAVLAVLGVLTVYAASVWGTKKIVRMMGADTGAMLPDHAYDESFMRQEMARSRNDVDQDGELWRPMNDSFGDHDLDYQDTVPMSDESGVPLPELESDEDYYKRRSSEYLMEVYGDDPAFFGDDSHH